MLSLYLSIQLVHLLRESRESPRESRCHLEVPIPGMKLKPSSAMLPFSGIEPVLLDADGMPQEKDLREQLEVFNLKTSSSS